MVVREFISREGTQGHATIKKKAQPKQKRSVRKTGRDRAPRSYTARFNVIRPIYLGIHRPCQPRSRALFPKFSVLSSDVYVCELSILHGLPSHYCQQRLSLS